MREESQSTIARLCAYAYLSVKGPPILYSYLMGTTFYYRIV